jgi:hypothetical protein
MSELGVAIIVIFILAFVVRIRTYGEGVPRRRVERYKYLLIIQERNRRQEEQRKVPPTEGERMRSQVELLRLEGQIRAISEPLLDDERALKYLSGSLHPGFDHVSTHILWTMERCGLKAIPHILKAAQFSRIRAEVVMKDSSSESREEASELYYLCLRSVVRIKGSIQCLFDMLRGDPYRYEVAEALALRGSAVIPYFCFLWQLNEEVHKDSTSEHMMDLREGFGMLIRRSIELKSDILQDKHGIVCKYRQLMAEILGERPFARVLEMLEPSTGDLIRRKLAHDKALPEARLGKTS